MVVSQSSRDRANSRQRLTQSARRHSPSVAGPAGVHRHDRIPRLAGRYRGRLGSEPNSAIKPGNRVAITGLPSSMYSLIFAGYDELHGGDVKGGKQASVSGRYERARISAKRAPTQKH